ncbi:hypothetical protein LJK88_18195 [Paenibacillus sp. P26]|nr:hypothetical protein LJK88_18195 [Paenibacillus sp. P26]
MLTRELAEEIVRETMVRLNRNINLMDPAGIILASGDSGRVGQFHEAAAEAIRRDREPPVKDEDLRRWKGAQKGINLPIHYEGRVVGAIGITGDPQEVRAFRPSRQNDDRAHDPAVSSEAAGRMEADDCRLDRPGAASAGAGYGADRTAAEGGRTAIGAAISDSGRGLPASRGQQRPRKPARPGIPYASGGGSADQLLPSPEGC